MMMTRNGSYFWRVFTVFLYYYMMVGQVNALEKAGPYNDFYQIPYSKGSRVAEWDSRHVIINDSPSLFYWNYNFNVDYKNNLWVADAKSHYIYYISKEMEDWNAIFLVAGKQGQMGMRDGNIAKATFNNPQSLVVYDYNTTAVKLMSKLKPIYLNGSSREREDCKYLTNANYTSCGYLIDEEFPYSIIDHTRVKYVSFAQLSAAERNESMSYGDYEARQVYIADSANHCIRRIVIR